jgi:polyisoprenyl-teichoic acid--peptidoglycan teichoic acid transferase
MRLEMAVAVARPLARLTTRDDDRVTELGPAAVEVIVDDQAAADAGAEREHDQVGHSPPRPEAPLGEGCGVAVVLDAGRKRVALARPVREVHTVEWEVHGPERDTGSPVDVQRHPVSDRHRTVRQQILDDAVDRAEHRGLIPVGRRNLDRAADRAVAQHQPCEDLRPAEVDPDNTLFTHVAATITARMPEQEKPYRVYKGGRAKGKVPLQRPTNGRSKDSGRGAPSSAPRRRRVGRWVTLSLLILIVLGVVWVVGSYISVSGGIKDANDRVPAPAAAELKSQSGLLSSKPTTILVLGTDGGSQPGRSDAHRSDSVMLIRTDPSKHRLAFLSIPRDLRVEIPGHGAAKLNAASQLGGPGLTLKTVKNLTGLDVNHIAVVNFDRFRELIDSVGGIDVVVPKPILSNRFDCPYASSARCQKWEGWRFEKGGQHMNGQRALVYSRIRENRLDPAETDLDRSRRQQQVIQETAGKVTSFGTALKLPFNGGSIVKPLATDLSAGQVMQLGWAYFRANKQHALHCRLGGEPGSADGQSVIFGSEDNVATLAMFTGRSAPLPPPKGLPYAPGCVIGDRNP